MNTHGKSSTRTRRHPTFLYLSPGKKKSIKGQQYTFTIKGNFDLLEKRKRKKKSTLFHSQVLGSRDHISE
jgi:hypothetical protein